MNKQKISKIIGEIKTVTKLSGTTNASIYLVNNQYIVKTNFTDINLVVNWYFHNFEFAPDVVYIDEQLIVYEYLNAKRNICKQDIETLICNYKPQITNEIDTHYIRNLQIDYCQSCNNFNLQTLETKLPIVDRFFNLHGDLGVHNMIIDSAIKFIDPEPRVGLIEHDLIQFYLSSPRLIELFPIEQFAMKLDIECFDFWFTRLLVDRIRRSNLHHPEDMDFYIELYNEYIKKTAN